MYAEAPSTIVMSRADSSAVRQCTLTLRIASQDVVSSTSELDHHPEALGVRNRASRQTTRNRLTLPPVAPVRTPLPFRHLLLLARHLSIPRRASSTRQPGTCRTRGTHHSEGIRSLTFFVQSGKR